jgi:hypothetical protein
LPKTHHKIRSDGGRHRLAGRKTALIAALLGLFAGSALAVEVTGLYTAQVVLDAEEQDPRAAAYDNALNEVLLRIAGSELSADPEMIELLFPNPAAYVVQFRPGDDDTLWVSFDGEAIERTLRSADRAVWGSDRPLTLVWLAVDWGQGEREILGADDPARDDDESRSIDRNRLLRQRVLDVAQRRGLPVVLPLLDTEDLQKISFSDIWGGFDEQLLAASSRYDVTSVLVGRIRPESAEQDRWSYYFGENVQAWSGEPELAVSLVADALAAEFSIGGSAALDVVDLSVSGIQSVEAYAAVQNVLSGLTVIDTFSITQADGERVLYRVSAHGGADRLRRALRLAGLIEQNGVDGDIFSPDSSSSSLEFFYSPN